MSKKIIIPIILVILLAVCGFFYFSTKDSNQSNQKQELKIDANDKEINQEESKISTEESDVSTEESKTESKLTEDEVKSQFNEIINQAFANLSSNENAIVNKDDTLARNVITAYGNRSENVQILTFLNVTTKSGKIFMGDGGGATNSLESAPTLGEQYQLSAIDYTQLNEDEMKASVSYQVDGRQYQRSFLIDYTTEITSIKTTEN